MSSKQHSVYSKKGRAKPPKSSTLRRTPYPDKKQKIIRIRLQDRIYDKAQEKADRHCNGNLSQFVRHCILKEIR